MSHYFYQLIAKWIKNDPEAWIALGDLETRLVARRLSPVMAPVYLCGMARSGTTILTEAVASHPHVATHTYRDFPCLFTPYLWNRILSTFDWVPFKKKPQERAHKDGILVTNRSPEAMEEMLWMGFFKRLHEETHSVVLGRTTGNQIRDHKFAQFYRAHLQKLLLARKKTRYVSKANYNITRIPYLLNIFPDARFVIVVRHPQAHIPSSYRLDKFFCAEQEKSPASLVHMDQVGHFEFGQHRTLINMGDMEGMTSVQQSFRAGQDIRGWARYWAMLHRFIQDNCQTYPEVLVVRHEDICAHPQDKMKQIFQHCRLEFDENILRAAAAKYRPITQLDIDENTKLIIQEETAGVAAQWGYI